MANYRSRNIVTNVVYLLQSRRRQAVVFGPAQIMILLGVLFVLGALLSDLTLTVTPLALTALVLGFVATYNGWQTVKAHGTGSALALGLLALGVLLVAGALLLLAGTEITLIWALMLVVAGVAALAG